MPSLRLPRLGGLVAAVVASAIAMTGAQQRPEPLTMGPARERGASVTPAFEGWYENEDGSFSLLIGYFNRNSKEALDIPIGPNNRIEPGAPDQGQPPDHHANAKVVQPTRMDERIHHSSPPRLRDPIYRASLTGQRYAGKVMPSIT